jgi:hypothetical protein
MSTTPKTNHTAWRAILIAGVAGLLMMTAGRMSAAEAPAAGAPKSLHVLHVGNSHCGALNAIPTLVSLTGHGNYNMEKLIRLGAPLSVCWEGIEKDPKIVTGKVWDAIILLCWGSDESDIDAGKKFLQAALKLNPKCQAYIYTIWPDMDDDVENPTESRVETHTERVADALAKAFPDALKPRVIPSSLIVRELSRMADRNELPGVPTRASIYDDYAHMGQIGYYAITTMVTSMMFQESPMSYPDIIIKPGGQQKVYEAGTAILKPETARAIKPIVWNILQTYPPAGMKPRLNIANRRLDPVVAGQSYKVAFSALNAKGNCAWSLSAGKLPDGLALSANSVLEGKTTSAGEYPITVKVADSQGSIECPLKLSVNADVAMTIPDQTLPETPLDQYVFQPIKPAGGVGLITWSISDGKMPYGIMLSPAGIVIGTPGVAGDYTFKIKVSDSHPAGARSAEREFKWKIGPASPDALPVKYVYMNWNDYDACKREPDQAKW